MLKVLKNLKESWISVIAIVVLLIVQAAGDLTLPDYTSKIVNVGIQNGGIENVAPEVIRKEKMENLLIFTENDDKIFNAKDVLSLCKKINRPMVLDYHHHICNPCDNIDDMLGKIFDTWKDIRPKVHFSSPKNKTKRNFRSHHDYINSDDFIQFIEKVKKYNVDIDIMIEAKAKDDALFRLVRELKYKTNYKFIDETSFEI